MGPLDLRAKNPSEGIVQAIRRRIHRAIGRYHRRSACDRPAPATSGQPGRFSRFLPS
jgi:hypothetical protein